MMLSRPLLLLAVLGFTLSETLVITPEEHGCVADGVTLCSKAIRTAVAQCKTAGGCTLKFAGPGTYLTQGFNLTSNIEVILGSKATILGTSEDRYNIHGDWPVLPWAEYPSLPTRTTERAFQAVVRSYNETNVTFNVEPGGMLDCGGTYWICMGYGTPAKSNGFCGNPDGKTPNLFCLHPPCNATCGPDPAHPSSTCHGRPRCMHLIGTDHIRINNLSMRNSPFWNLHFQFSNDIVVDGLKVYQLPGAANADGIDVDSSSNVVIRNSMVDSNDDHLCVKSGADWLGRQAGVPSQNVIFEDIEIRSGHGMTLGSEMSGGVRNITYRNIKYNASASSSTAYPGGPPKPHGAPGGAHFKTQRGRGGYIKDILYENIYGDGAGAAISFTMLHGAGPPVNATATPYLSNITIRNMALTGVMGDGFGAARQQQQYPQHGYDGTYQTELRGESGAGVESGRALSCAYIDTLAESPIHGLYLENISITGRCGQSFRCESFVGDDTSGNHEFLFATGNATDVTINRDVGIGAPNRCRLGAVLPPPPPPPPPPTPPAPPSPPSPPGVVCKVATLLACLNIAAPAQDLLPVYRAELHDHVSLENCAAGCHASKMGVAGIDGGNHCHCGPLSALSGPVAKAETRPLAECSPKNCPMQPKDGCSCSGKTTERCGAPDRQLVYNFTCN